MKIPYKAPIIQGDVILKRIEMLPPEAVLVERNNKVLQESETTGHHHQFSKDSLVNLYQVAPEVVPGIATITDNKGYIIDVIEPSYLFHGKLFDHQPQLRGTGDHASILIEPGIYVVDIVREYDYNYHETVRVRD
jgi:hypothetical protein